MSRVRAVCLRALALLLAAFVPAVAVAGPHQHGVATLDVVVDGGQLLVRIESPLDNLVGFEHAPRTDRQRAALASARDRLADGGALLRTSPEARCTPLAAKIDLPFIAAEKKHDHGAHGHDDAVHSEASVEWEFSCAMPAALRDVEVRLFDAFRRLETLRVQTATPRGQGSATLTARRRLLELP